MIYYLLSIYYTLSGNKQSINYIKYLDKSHFLTTDCIEILHQLTQKMIYNMYVYDDVHPNGPIIPFLIPGRVSICSAFCRVSDS